MEGQIADLFNNKKILILGFGKEGISCYKLLIKTVAPEFLTIADQDENLTKKLDFPIDKACHTAFGRNYLSDIDTYDLVIKSPGIPTNLLTGILDRGKLTSQTELFLKLFAAQTIGSYRYKRKKHHLKSDKTYPLLPL